MSVQDEVGWDRNVPKTKPQPHCHGESRSLDQHLCVPEKPYSPLPSEGFRYTEKTEAVF